MLKMFWIAPRALVASLMVISVIGSGAWAQRPSTVRVRGTIEAVDGSLLSVKSREGNELKIRMTDNVAVVGVTKIAMSEIKPGSYIGVSAMPEPDGTRRRFPFTSSPRPSAAWRKVFGLGISGPTAP